MVIVQLLVYQRVSDYYSFLQWNLGWPTQKKGSTLPGVGWRIGGKTPSFPGAVTFHILPPIPWHRAQQLALQSSNMASWEISDQLPSWNIKILLKNGEFSGVYYKLKPSIFCRVKLFAAGKWKGPVMTCRKANAMESMAQNRWYDPVGSCWWFMACFNRPQQYIYIFVQIPSKMKTKTYSTTSIYKLFYAIVVFTRGTRFWLIPSHPDFFSPLGKPSRRKDRPRKRNCRNKARSCSASPESSQSQSGAFPSDGCWFIIPSH